MSEAEYDTNLQYDGHDPFDGCTSNIEQLLAENAELKDRNDRLAASLAVIALGFYVGSAVDYARADLGHRTPRQLWAMVNKVIPQKAEALAPCPMCGGTDTRNQPCPHCELGAANREVVRLLRAMREAQNAIPVPGDGEQAWSILDKALAPKKEDGDE